MRSLRAYENIQVRVRTSGCECIRGKEFNLNLCVLNNRAHRRRGVKGYVRRCQGESARPHVKLKYPQDVVRAHVFRPHRRRIVEEYVRRCQG